MSKIELPSDQGVTYSYTKIVKKTTLANKGTRVMPHSLTHFKILKKKPWCAFFQSGLRNIEPIMKPLHP
jgi:hypothetical protein